jgi:adenosylcobinamide-phosphate synthase
VRLAKPGVYVLNAEGRSAEAADTLRSALLGGRAMLALAVCASLVIVATARWT